jgi:hypothetical protein
VVAGFSGQSRHDHLFPARPQPVLTSSRHAKLSRRTRAVRRAHDVHAPRRASVHGHGCMRHRRIACLPIRTRKTFVAGQRLARPHGIAAKIRAAIVDSAQRLAFRTNPIGTACIIYCMTNRSHRTIRVGGAIFAWRNSTHIGPIGTKTIKIAVAIRLGTTLVAVASTQDASSFARRNHCDSP